jgi:hypothetical protein
LSIIGCPRRDAERISDLLVETAANEEPEHFGLARAKPGYQRPLGLKTVVFGPLSFD